MKPKQVAAVLERVEAKYTLCAVRQGMDCTKVIGFDRSSQSSDGSLHTWEYGHNGAHEVMNTFIAV